MTFLFGAGMVAVFAVFLIGVAVTAHGRQLRALPRQSSSAKTGAQLSCFSAPSTTTT